MVRLETISIQRFRGICEGKVEGFADVNLFVGRNNSGKTTVAEAIAWVAAIASFRHRTGGSGWGTDPIGRPPFHVFSNARNQPIEPSAELWYRQDQKSPIVVSAKIDTETIGFSLEETTKSAAEIGSRDTPIQPKLVWHFAHHLAVFRPPDAVSHSIERNLWSRLLASRRDKALTQALNEIFGLGLEQMQLPPDGRLMLLFPDYSLPLDVQGDGTRAALRCLMFLSSLDGTLFILEEPEDHQHPGSLERFARAVCKLARAQEVQLLITTHSSECVRAFLGAAKDAGSTSAVHHLKLDNGLLDARHLDAPAVESLLASGVDVRWLDLYV